jgi:hypothetical protein
MSPHFMQLNFSSIHIQTLDPASHRVVIMPPLFGTWTKLAESDDLRRSSQTLSVIDNQAFVFGGELVPRQPVDSKLHVIDIKTDKLVHGELPYLMTTLVLGTPHGKSPALETSQSDAFL